MSEQQASIQDRVIAILAEQSGMDSVNITTETQLIRDLDPDDIDLAELQIAFENEFEVDVPEDLDFSEKPRPEFGNDPSNVEMTVGQIIAGIEKRLHGRPAVGEVMD